jgi:hypothetical protein
MMKLNIQINHYFYPDVLKKLSLIKKNLEKGVILYIYNSAQFVFNNHKSNLFNLNRVFCNV